MNQKKPRCLKKIGEYITCICGCGLSGVVIGVSEDEYEVEGEQGNRFMLNFLYVHDEKEFVRQAVNKPEGY